jgi:hypothetical protein
MALNPIVDSRDVRFILFEMFEIDKLNRFERFADFDRDTYEEILNLAERIAVEQVYPANSPADKKHAQYKPETKEVIIPEEFYPGLNAYYEAGFLGLSLDQEVGGMGMPEVMFSATTDYFGSASCSMVMYPMLSVGALRMFLNYMPDSDEKKIIVEKMLSGEWGGTMCLTESNAGSDVGALNTKAKKNSDGTYSIQGQKIFISGGDHGYYENIIHPVLARIEGDPAGTKGISIYTVPKYQINKDGSNGPLNDCVCSGIEHKMGITASVTCTLNFGDEGKCKGVLMGEERQGMKIMFQMMNEARQFVSCQGMSVSSAAYMHAVTYARNRVQGKKVQDMMNPDASSTVIINHPDVKRMLLSMKSKVEAMRSLSYLCGLLTDIAHVEKGEAKAEAQALLDFIIPIAKAGNTDTAWDVASDAIQVYGGYGFCSDYPVEQYARDAKILAIYEGTNGIQSLDLAMRKLLMSKDFYNYKIFKKWIEKTIEQAKGVVDEKYVKNLQDAVAKIDETVNYLKSLMDTGKFLHIFANATPLQKAFVMLTYGWMQLWGLVYAAPKQRSLVADKKGDELEKFLENNKEAAFYMGRVLSGQFFLGAEILKISGMCDYILQGDSSVVKTTGAIFSGALME